MWVAMGQCYEHDNLSMDEAAKRCYRHALLLGDREGTPSAPTLLSDTFLDFVSHRTAIATRLAPSEKVDPSLVGGRLWSVSGICLGAPRCSTILKLAWLFLSPPLLYKQKKKRELFTDLSFRTDAMKE